MTRESTTHLLNGQHHLPVDNTRCRPGRLHTDAMTSELAAPGKLRYPKLRPQIPVLRRAEGEVQVGVDCDTALIFSEPKLVPLLLALDGAHHVRDIRNAGAGAGLRVDEVEQVLGILDDACMLLEGGRSSTSHDAPGRQSVRLIGAGSLGAAVARLLAQSRIGRLWVIDTEPSCEEVRGPGSGRAEALRATLADEFDLPVATAKHWSRPSPAEIDLTIIVSDAAETDRLIADDLVRMDQPHLVLRPAGDLVTVGPLVIPGRTACLRCTDLTRRDADTAWPALLDQLTRLRLPTPVALGSWAASMAATQALAFLRGRTPEACGSTIELSELDLVTRWRTWLAHPGCGCYWFSAGQWGA
jgi:hypothetical protein